MGSCFSSGGGGHSITDMDKSNFALVITAQGNLRQYASPVFVSEVLHEMEMKNVSSSSSSSGSLSSLSFFVCCSDDLYYEERIRALDLENELELGQIYFVLPKTKLRHPLSASDMAALAVRASSALNSNSTSSDSISSSSSSGLNNNGLKKKNKARISPVVASRINVMVEEEGLGNSHHDHKQLYYASIGVSKSGSIRKMPRYSSSSRKGGPAQRMSDQTFKLSLSTIHESETTDDQTQAY